FVHEHKIEQRLSRAKKGAGSKQSMRRKRRPPKAKPAKAANAERRAASTKRPKENSQREVGEPAKAARRDDEARGEFSQRVGQGQIRALRAQPWSASVWRLRFANEVKLLIAKGNDGIDTHGAAGRNIAGHESDCDEQGCAERKDRRIGGANAVQQRAEKF